MAMIGLTGAGMGNCRIGFLGAFIGVDARVDMMVG